jgi:aryl sulfotransferase
MRRYAEPDADNARWEGFEFRDGDVIISAPSKSGTTWTQLLVALLIFDGPDFPEPISMMSPWMDQKTRSVDEAHGLLAVQEHRRFIKTHTPLDGLPLVEEVRYVCVGRDPRDAVVSMKHHPDNVDREVFSRLIGSQSVAPVGTLSDRFDRFLDGDDFPRWSLRLLAHQYQTYWDARDRDNVDLFHFADYSRDLPGELRRLAEFLGIEATDERVGALATEAAIERVRGRAADVAPEAHFGLWKDTSKFFRSGSVGEGVEAMTGEQRDRYDALVRELMAPELAHWVHEGWGG